MSYCKISNCRLCRTGELVELFSLGMQALTGVFPKSRDIQVAEGPLTLAKCSTCHLVQLAHSFQPDMMYGQNYGYRSGLNQSMVNHLKRKVEAIRRIVDTKPDDLIIDIGSNDSTLLRQYPHGKLVGVDPSGVKFKSYYPAQIALLPEFFSAALIREKFAKQRAKVITSIAMFYDLDDPTAFMRDVESLLDRDGLWVFEQSYLPLMMDVNSYDTICHEHLEYYGLQQIKRMTDAAGLKIVGLEFNDVNAGSFSVAAAKREASYLEARALIDAVLALEEARGLNGLRPYREFWERARQHRDAVRSFFEQAKAEKKAVLGYGASTKGNVLLQFCGIGTGDMAMIAEVNKEKFGCFTPGTGIPIVSESDARARNPDYLFVLPWHFKDGIVRREQEFRSKGGKLVFPLPELTVVS